MYLSLYYTFLVRILEPPIRYFAIDGIIVEAIFPIGRKQRTKAQTSGLEKRFLRRLDQSLYAANKSFLIALFCPI